MLSLVEALAASNSRTAEQWHTNKRNALAAYGVSSLFADDNPERMACGELLIKRSDTESESYAEFRESLKERNKSLEEHTTQRIESTFKLGEHAFKAAILDDEYPANITGAHHSNIWIPDSTDLPEVDTFLDAIVERQDRVLCFQPASIRSIPGFPHAHMFTKTPFSRLALGLNGETISAQR